MNGEITPMPDLKLSSYLIVCDKTCNPNELILASGLSGAVLVIDKTLFNDVSNELNNRETSEEIRNAIELLKEHGLLVKESIDECAMVKDIFKNSAADDGDIFSISFVLTYRCNFKCPYCYETEKDVDMTTELIDEIFDKIISPGAKSKKRLDIQFFGGEPLLRIDLVKYIVHKAREYARYNKKISFRMITNGSLITQELVELFSSEKDLSHVQITLDGPKNIHDKRRIFKNGAGSYDIIIKNIPLAIAASNSVGVRVNVDKENITYVPELIDCLNKFSDDILVSFGYVTNYQGRGSNRSCILPHSDFCNQHIHFLSMLREKKFRCSPKHILGYKHITCPASLALPHWIDPYGDIYCCEHAIGKRGLAVGNIIDGIYENKRKYWMNYNLLNNDICLKCKAVFFCSGACPVNFKNRRFTETECHAIDGLLNELVSFTEERKSAG